MKEFAYMKVGGHSQSSSQGGTGWKMPLRLSFNHVVFAVLGGFMLHFFSHGMDLEYTFQKVSMQRALCTSQYQN